MGAVLSCVLIATMCAGARGEVEVYGAEPNPTGDPIGGGQGYSRIVNAGDYTVSTADELLAALSVAQPGEIVYVAPGAEIDLGDRKDVTIPEGVTLAGNRGHDGSAGPVIHGSALPDGQQMLLARANARITGLRIRGRDCNFAEIDYDRTPRSWSRAIMVVGADVEIDNCEISNVHHSGVDVKGGSCHIHHNHIHDVHAYPVVVVGGAWPPPLIEANLIYWVWHAIAGTGAPGTGYEARYNIIVGGDIPPSWGRRYHCFDMHAYRPLAQAGHEKIAGDTILIHHNTVREMGDALGARIRGIPRDIAEIHHNWFTAPDVEQAVEQVDPPGNLWVHDNAHGPDRTVIRIGGRTTARITFRRPPPAEEELPLIAGELALDFDVEMMAGLTLQSVAINLDGNPLYEDTEPPQPGAVSINTADLDDGVHELTVVVTDNRGMVTTYPRFFVVEN